MSIEQLPGNVVVPSSVEDRKKLKSMLAECTHCLQRKDDESAAMKDIIAEIHAQFDIPKKIATKLARTMYKRDYDSLQAENEDFESLYTVIVEGAKAAE